MELRDEASVPVSTSRVSQRSRWSCWLRFRPGDDQEETTRRSRPGGDDQEEPTRRRRPGGDDQEPVGFLAVDGDLLVLAAPQPSMDSGSSRRNNSSSYTVVCLQTNDQLSLSQIENLPACGADPSMHWVRGGETPSLCGFERHNRPVKVMSSQLRSVGGRINRQPIKLISIMPARMTKL
ncbi:unnamed protein product [Pleuronectes platessa]|uniref:Uncharacterized protein n=1 Tax=Pleuronectes platessa TaxID=8262 RepID=A0A9N7UZG9_PLEPL|nr:unnamed protein product [Pleuronectes platessa]